jgi:ubiquinone/menaquinone biosynthesis C-methylase UbiE
MPEIAEHYSVGYEQARLREGTSQLEFARTCEVITRYFPRRPAVVLDVGGGPGVYACWLAKLGYTVHLIDALPLHVEQARAKSRSQSDAPLASATVGDARKLQHPDACADAVLLLGPLYHLTERADRLTAWREARRVLKPGGFVIAAAISRYASVLDGMRIGLLFDPIFAPIVAQDLRDGQHRNPTLDPRYFTTGYFHPPEELRVEACEAGLQHEATLAVEGPFWLMQDFDSCWTNPERRERLISLARQLESEPALLGVSAHLIAVARK